MYLSVYGTLKNDGEANYMLDGCQFISMTNEILPFKMYNFGSYPGLIKSNTNNNITIETYLITKDVLNNIDEYEEYPEIYKRKSIKLSSGIYSWIYFIEDLQLYPDKIEIKNGYWLNKQIIK